MVERVVNFFTSLRLTVVCLSFAVLLVFFGTLAQVDLGLYATQEKYFRSLLVYWSPAALHWSLGDIPTSYPRLAQVLLQFADVLLRGLASVLEHFGAAVQAVGGPDAKVPVLPGGYLLGGVLLVNLVAAHIKRFTLSRKKIGIFMVHAGLILLLLGQLLTDLLSNESTMHLREGDTRNYSETEREAELVEIDVTDAATDKVVAVPERMLAAGGAIHHEALPFQIAVKSYFAHSTVTNRPPTAAGPPQATQGVGTRVQVTELPRTTAMNLRDVPSAVIELSTPSGVLGSWLVSEYLDRAETVTVNQRNFALALRPRRHYKPFQIELLRFTHEVYKGTDTPRNFSSRIRLRRADQGEDREVDIYMNNPLRYGGETYYQASFDPDDHGTVFQVVRNPGWLTPYLSCLLVGAGLLVQFLTHLVGFIKRRST